jgi:hypothetical protein
MQDIGTNIERMIKPTFESRREVMLCCMTEEKLEPLTA